MSKNFSLYKLFFILILGIFTTEFFIMFVIDTFAEEGTAYLELLDGLSLIVIMSPLVYFFAVKPLSKKITELEESKVTVRDLAMHDETLERDKAKDEALLTSIGEGMLVTDKDGRITIVNPAAEKILGWSADELIGQIMVKIIPSLDDENKPLPDDSRAMTLILNKQNTDSISKTSRYVRKDGNIVPVAVTINPVILNKKLIGAIEIFRNITKEREMEKMRQDLLSLASHQLRTPLSGTKWLIETLRRGVHGPMGKEQTEYLDEIYKINERMTALVSDMLSTLRIESGATLTKYETITISSLFETLSGMMSSAAKEKKIALNFVHPKGNILTTDPMLLRNILESFVSNAITYSPENTEIVIDFKDTKTAVTFSVKDAGIGIPKDEQDGIFNRFYRASNAKTFNTRGSGLGLYIASMLAEKIDAKLSFESAEGKGSIFYVHVPKEVSAKNNP